MAETTQGPDGPDENDEIDPIDLQLIEAVRDNDLAAVDAALAVGADVNAQVWIPRYGKDNLASPAQPALGWAWQVPMAERLLAAGANLDGKDRHGLTALHRNVLNARDARRDHHYELVEFLLARGANPNTSVSSFYSTPLEQTTISGPGIARLLLAAGARITAAALNHASRRPELLTLLEEWPIRSAPLPDRDRELLLAARLGDLKVVEQLLRAGADATARDTAGRSAHDHALAKQHAAVALRLEQTTSRTHAAADLFGAVLADAPEQIRAAFKNHSLEVRNAEGLTPLMLAARHGRIDAARSLLSLGAAIDARHGAASAIVYAIERGDLAMLRLLLAHGAAINTRIEGVNPVFVAANAQSDSDLVKELLLRGLDLATRPSRGSPVAESRRLVECACAGILPVAQPMFTSPTLCDLCAALPDKMGWFHPMNGERTGEAIPEVTKRFETFVTGWQPLQKCPHCSTYYEYESDHDNGIPDGWDSETLTRIAPERALEKLRDAGPSPRNAREIAALETRLATTVVQ